MTLRMGRVPGDTPEISKALSSARLVIHGLDGGNRTMTGVSHPHAQCFCPHSRAYLLSHLCQRPIQTGGRQTGDHGWEARMHIPIWKVRKLFRVGQGCQNGGIRHAGSRSISGQLSVQKQLGGSPLKAQAHICGHFHESYKEELVALWCFWDIAEK